MHLRNKIQINKVIEMAGALGISICAFILLTTAIGIDSQAPTPPPPPSVTEWKIHNPDVSKWLTSTLPISVQVQVTDTEGVHTDPILYYFDAQYGVPQTTVLSVNSIVLVANGLVLTQGQNPITFTVFVTRGNNEINADQTYTMQLDSVAPTATIMQPNALSVWAPNTNVTISWTITEVTSGLSMTQVWFKPTAAANSIFITTTTASTVTWTVPNTVTNQSSDATVELILQDVAGNRSRLYSSQFEVEKPPTFVYLPIVRQERCDNEAADWCEPNNSIATAFPLQLNLGITATINMTPDRSDYYQLTLPSIMVYTATLKLVQPCADPTPKCDLDLYLYNSTSALVASANQAGIGNETLVFTPANTSPYYLRVYAFSTTITPTTYTLIVK